MAFEVVDDHSKDATTPGWQYAATSGILGWVLDAFDFFVVVFLVQNLADNFHVDKKAIVLSITVTLALRPVGALIFGALADRYGRRIPLMVCVLYFSFTSALSGFAPNYATFLDLRALYGIGMWGYWGIGASIAMESASRRIRGLVSGMMQGGYPFGYLLAAIGMIYIPPMFGWKAMFLVGFSIAVLVALFVYIAPESEAWQEHRMPSVAAIFRTLFEHKKEFGYLLLVMSVMTCLSHGTQDLYPDFLKSEHHLVQADISHLAIFYNIAAVTGALLFGYFSEHLGRRYSIITALVLSLISIPWWAFGGTIMALTIGSIAMQAGVQGAFGVIPAHLNELSPDAVRSLFPGFVYQLGVLVASPATAVEFVLRDHFGYPWALTMFEAGVIVLMIVIFWFGPEARDRSFLRESQQQPVAVE